MKKTYLFILAAALILSGFTMSSCTGIEDTPVIPQPTPEPEPEPEPEPVVKEIFELGKPDDDNYRYLDELNALKEYIDYAKFPTSSWVPVRPSMTISGNRQSIR